MQDYSSLAAKGTTLAPPSSLTPTGGPVCDRCLQPVDMKMYSENLERLQRALIDAEAAAQQAAARAQAIQVAIHDHIQTVHLRSWVYGRLQRTWHEAGLVTVVSGLSTYACSLTRTTYSQASILLYLHRSSMADDTFLLVDLCLAACAEHKYVRSPVRMHLLIFCVQSLQLSCIELAPLKGVQVRFQVGYACMVPPYVFAASFSIGSASVSDRALNSTIEPCLCK